MEVFVTLSLPLAPRWLYFRMSAAGPLELEAEIDRLYAEPIAGFVAARKELAARLRSRGDREGARRVGALPRPSATAWAVNALYWRHRALFDAVRRSGERVRRAHEGAADAGSLAGALGERRELLAAAMRTALEELVAAGHAAASAAERRIRGTLEAVAAGVAIEPREGRLSADLEPPSFDVLAGLAPALAPAAPVSPGRAVPAVSAPESGPALGAADRQAERNALALAEAERSRLQRQVERAEEGERAARVRAEAASAEIGEAERRLERARRRREEVAAELERARGESAAARQALAQAQRALEAARSRIGG